jgi:hypothetical protein
MLNILVVRLVLVPIHPLRLPGAIRDPFGQWRETVGRVDALLAPGGMSYGPGKEGLHRFDRDAFCLGDPDEGEDAAGLVGSR